MNLKKFVENPYRIFSVMASKGTFDGMSDEKFLKYQFKARIGKRLDLNNPQTFNEKLQWLKLNDRKPEYTVMVDKYLVRRYIADKIGEEYLIPLLGVWDSPRDIDFDALPDKFVLKCNHNSGTGMCICKDKSKLDIARVEEDLQRGLEQDYYLTGREWPYKNVPRKIICEQYMTDSPDSNDFTDYKFFCFNGKVDSVMLCMERSSGDTKFYFFDKNWNLCRYNIRGKSAPPDFTVPKPQNIDAMFELAARLSEGIPFVRVDLYNSDGHIYFGEMTFFPDSGFDANLLPETDLYFGNLIDLGEVKDENRGLSDKS